MTSDEVRVYLTQAATEALARLDGYNLGDSGEHEECAKRARAVLAVVETLRTPCSNFRCEEGVISKLGRGRRVVQYDCPTCGGPGVSGLLAFDEMRGGEWVTDELLNKPCLDDTVLMRFPVALLSPDTTKMTT